MASSDRHAPLARILEALRARVEDTSVRSVAQEIGISHRGLGKILAGSRLQARTRNKLDQWYGRWSDRQSQTDDTDEAAALHRLVSHIPAVRRKEALLLMVQCLERVYRSMNVPVPISLQNLHNSLADGDLPSSSTT